MLRAIILIAVGILQVCHVQAQKEANHFGFYNFELDFTSGEAVVQRNFAPHLNRGMGLISDKDGNLLFYTDGFTVFNKSHNAMPNGFSLLPSNSSTKTQESIVIPRPGNDNIYYIFSTDPFNGQSSSGLYYSEVDLSLDGGMGDVTTKGVKLAGPTTNKLSACLHSDGRGVWVMAHKSGSNTFVLVSVTEDGISSPVKEQSIGMKDQYFGVQMKFSPDSRKLAISYANPEAGLIIFDFNSTTGVLSNPIEFSANSEPLITGAIDFSSDAKKLYLTGTGTGSIGQLDLSSSDPNSVRNSLQVLKPNFLYSGPYKLQLAPDGKIYGTKGGGQAYGNAFLMVVNNPNDNGSEVIVNENGLYLEGGDSFVGFTPNFIQNYFYQTSFKLNGNCENSPITFQLTNDYRVDSVMWSFGNGATSKALVPSTVYNTHGTYTVKLDVFYAGAKKTVSREIRIDPVHKFELGETQTVCDGTLVSVEDAYNSYEWNTGGYSNSIKAHETGWYKLTVKNEFGCAFTDSVMLNVIGLPVIDLPDSIEVNVGSITLDPGLFSRYSWSNDSTTRTIDVNITGWYSVLVQDERGCKNAKSVFVYRTEELQDHVRKWKWLNPTPSGLPGRDIRFVNDSIGFVLNSEELLQTTSGGDSWKVIMQMPSARRIIFRDSIGYIIGDHGLIYKSTHLGAGWNRIQAGINDNLIGLSVINKDTIRITSATSLFSSNDGGRSWQSSLISGIQITDSHFTSGKIGHVVGLNGIILKTTDGGQSWNIKLTSNVIPSNFLRVTFVTKNLGFATRAHSELYRTIDGGETWTRTGFNADAGYSIHFVNENVGFVAGEHGAIHKTTDGGVTWDWVGFDGRIWANDINSIFFVNEKHGYATGMRGRIIRTFDGGATWEQYSVTYNQISQLEFPSQTTGYALLWNSILRTENGGRDWAKTANPEVSYISGIDFVTNEIGYAAGGGSSGNVYNIYKTSNAGATWLLQSKPQIGDIRKIYFINENVGFATAGGTAKTIDGGQTWTIVSSTQFRCIQFVSPLIGYANSVGWSNNKIYKTIDGGDTWLSVFDVEDDITSIHFVNAEEGYIVGDAAIMYKTLNGGKDWERLTVPYAYYIDVAFVTKDLGYILDDYGTLYMTKNGGASWSTDYRLYGLRDINVNEQQVYLSGDFGAILVAEAMPAEPITITIGPLSPMGITESEATISSVIKSTITLESVPLTLELGQQPGIYNSSYEAGVYNVGDTPVSFKITNLEAGAKYYCRFKIVYKSKTITSPELMFETSAVTGISENAFPGLKIYPNPTRSIVTIDYPNMNTPLSYELSGLRGEVYAAGTVEHMSMLDFSTTSSGIYILQLWEGSRRLVFRIIKE